MTCPDYVVGDPKSATITVNDNDKPDAPTGLRANGDFVDSDGDGNRDGITLRWNKVSGATSYNVRYVEETCRSGGVCGPKEGQDGPDWETSAAITSQITIDGSTVIEAKLGGLTPKKPYRVEVRVVIVDSSEWSDFVVAYPTSSPPQPTEGPGGAITELSPPRILTAPLYGYQAKNAKGSHEFSYVVCEDTIPASVTTAAGSKSRVIADIKAAVGRWDEAVRWSTGRVNILATRPLPDSTPCIDPFSISPSNNQIMFVTSQAMSVARCINMQVACWRSPTWSERAILKNFLAGEGLPAIDPGAVFLWDSLGAGWYGTQGSGCRVLRTQVVHEVGHAFGIGWPVLALNHPINEMHSIMSERRDTQHCEPQPYDTVATMANYQSR